jgi:hypothetical protein
VVAVQVLRVAYPNCHIFPFRPSISFEDAAWSPDIAIVEKTHRYWFVGEVETGSHHLEKHVIPQTLAFVEGRYGSDAIAILSRELKVSDKVAATIVSYIPRYVAVVSNQPNDAWTRKLQSINVQHLAISSYYSPVTHQTIHSVDGFLVPAEECLGFGRVRATDNAIVTPSQDVWKDGNIRVISPRGLNTWTCTTAGKSVWVMKRAGVIEFPDGSIVQLLRRSDGLLLFRLPYIL